MVQVQACDIQSLRLPIVHTLNWLEKTLCHKSPHPREGMVAQSLRDRLESLPSDGEQFCFLVNWTDSAIRLILDGERLAARYQLQQVLRKIERLLD